MTNLGRMLKLYCRVKNISVRKLAAELGISHTTTCRMQNGHSISQENLLKVINWLLDDDWQSPTTKKITEEK